MQRRLLAWPAAILLIAVVLGAFGAHGLKGKISPEALGQWGTGVQYQFYHGLGMLMVVALGGVLPPATVVRSIRLFGLGILLFSGSLYLLSTRELTGLASVSAWIGPLTPLGGLAFIAGWATVLITALRRNDRG